MAQMEELRKYERMRAKLNYQERYMLRNTSGDYTIEDFKLIWFAMETTDRVIKNIKKDMHNFEASRRADARFKITQRINLLEETFSNEFHQVDVNISNISDLELDSRDVIDDIYTNIIYLYKDQLIAFIAGDKVFEEDAKAVIRNRPSPRSHEHELKFILYAENAERTDIEIGEDEDFNNLVNSYHYSLKDILDP